MSKQPKTIMIDDLIDEMYDDEYSYEEMQEARSYAEMSNFDLKASDFEPEWN